MERTYEDGEGDPPYPQKQKDLRPEEGDYREDSSGLIKNSTGSIIHNTWEKHRWR